MVYHGLVAYRVRIVYSNECLHLILGRVLLIAGVRHYVIRRALFV